MHHVSPQSSLYIGLMSGTSADGIDAALWDDTQKRLVTAHYVPYDDAFRHRLLKAMHWNIETHPTYNLNDIGHLEVDLTHQHAHAVNTLLQHASLKPADIAAVGFHGHNINHQPFRTPAFTWQLGDPSRLSAKTGITVIGHFRRRDIALGGQGAPLAPLFHQMLWHSQSENRLILNLGGIANITYLPKIGSPLAYDTGPANMLMDACMQLYFDAPYDKNGEMASSGDVDTAWLEKLLTHAYFQKPPPKSAGREIFHWNWVEETKPKTISPADCMATLRALTSESIARACRKMPIDKIWVCGGGAYNTGLLQDLGARLGGHIPIRSTAEGGLDPKWVESALFAWLAAQTMQGNALDTRPFTGASQPAILGGIYPVPKRVAEHLV